MRDNAINSFRLFFEPALLQEIFALIRKSKRNPISQSILEHEYPVLKRAEDDFNMCIKGMYWETEQLFNLASPLIHPAIREHLKADQEELENDCKKKNLFNVVSKAMTPGTSNKKSSTKKSLDYDSFEFEEYSKYIESLLDKFKYELSFFFPDNNITPITFTRKVEVEKRPSVFTEYSLNHVVIQNELFNENCKKFSEWIEDQNGKQIKLLNRDEKGTKFTWSESLPLLGLFLRALWEANIIRGIPKEKVAKLMMQYFNVSDERMKPDNINFTARFFGKDLIGKHENQYRFIQEKLIKSLR